MKIITLYTSILIIALCSFSAFAAESHLDQAIKHAEVAAKSGEGKSIAQHADEAKTHAEAAKTEKIDESHLNAGIKSLDEAIKNGGLGATELAKKSAEEAVTHLKQAAK